MIIRRILGQTDEAPTSPEWELFDLVKDPAEMSNVYGLHNYESITQTLKEQLKALQLQYRDEGLEYPEMPNVQADYFWTSEHE